MHVRLLFALSLLVAGCSAEKRERTAKIDFNRQIRPIFNQNCTACHGGVKAAGGISFVFREDALRAGDSKRRTIVPGHPEQSELIARIVSTDPDFRMPKPDHGAPLSQDDVALFRQWISEGAEWSEHWAFVPPKEHTPPAVADAVWMQSPVDRFVRSRLDQEKLSPSAPADRATLLRRVSFDLIGLPPTPAELDTFIADTRPDAYERQVDRLLASPRYGERWATLWMDLARYADTKGYEKDEDRTVWKYRDWLIDALNRNQPYNAFAIDQLAGDLVPNATLEQRIATTFNRNTQTNDEGGTDDEEFRMAAVIDRVATTWSVFNGVTFGCIQCHSHPYDPIRHEEYYQFLAFFNTSKDADYNSEFPSLRIPEDSSRYAEADQLRAESAKLERELGTKVRALVQASTWTAAPIRKASSQPAAVFELKEGEAFPSGTLPTQVIFDLFAEGPRNASALTALRIEIPPLDPEKARHTPEMGFSVSRVDAWLLSPDGSEVPLAFQRFVIDTDQPAEATFEKPAAATAKPKDPKVKPRFVPTVAASLAAPGALAAPGPRGPVVAALPTPIPPPGVPSSFAAMPSLSTTRWTVGILRKPLELKPGQRIKIRLSHGRMISSRPAPVRRVRLSVSDDRRWTDLGSEPALQRKRDRVGEIVRTLAKIPGVDQPVMDEQPPEEHRETRLFVRGNWMDKGGPALTPNVPALFPPLPAGAEPNRLAMARWFFSEKQPLTARAAVNRYWEQLYGIGLVETLEDYGSVGENPSHPELLDWLARHFQFDLAWDVKALLRELVTTQTYRQSATMTAESHERDPRNRLLARGPRNRLTAEMVRDQAMAASGLLSTKMHGAPVMPFQPAGVWASPYNGRDWKESKGEDSYRRAVYTFWKRTAAYPSFLNFDASARDVCVLRRIPTNTPLQALVMLNDPVYDDASRALATAVRQEAGVSAAPRAWIEMGWKRVMTSAPTDAEMAPLVRLYDDALHLVGNRPDPELNALAAVATALLNLDAALNK